MLAAPPRVPRAFAGASKMATGKGSDLLSAYAELDRGMKHWTEACHGDAVLAGVLYRWVATYVIECIYIYMCV